MDVSEGGPAPRLCHVIKWPEFDGFGFNLHADKNKTGQFIGKIDENSPAELSGLQEGDRIVEVNGVNIANENHKQVVARVKAIPKETKLLVVDENADDWYKSRGIVVKSSMKIVTHIKTPVPRPAGLSLPVQNSEIIETRPLQQTESVDEESGESVRKFDNQVENGPNVTTATESTEEKELSDKLSHQNLDDDDDDKPIEPPLPSSVSNVDSNEVSSEEHKENVDTNDNSVVIDKPIVFENNDDELEAPIKSNENESLNVDLSQESVVNMKNEVNSGLDTEDGDSNSLKENTPHTYIEDEMKKESIRAETPTSDRKSLDESSQSSRSSEHRETPPTTPTTPLPDTPEPVRIETAKDIKSNGHSNEQRSSSGLNLNMSVQEMREKLAQRKKKDVRQNSVDMLTKYKLVEKM